MISVAEATRLIHEHLFIPGTEEVSLDKCFGRVLREDLIADRDFPPFDRVTMDGIAINHAAWEGGVRRYKIQETVAAGIAQVRLQDMIDCIEIMTGAVLPDGCDTVIRYEDLKIENGFAEVVPDEIVKGKNVHAQGTDRKVGEIVVRSGAQITSAEIGVAATIGKSKLKVAALPRIAVISTGDELVDIHETPMPHQIRKSNVAQINAALSQRGVQVESFHLADDATEVGNTLSDLLETFDCLILSGGVSAGKFDYVPGALEKLDVEKVFHKVAQRPGKPFWFGVKRVDVGSGINPDSPSRPVVFALPGNPVSAFMCTLRYILPWLDVSLGIPIKAQYAVLTENFHFKPLLTYFLQVNLSYGEDGVLRATPVEGHGSGDLANLVEANGFLELGEGREDYTKGQAYRCLQFS